MIGPLLLTACLLMGGPSDHWPQMTQKNADLRTGMVPHTVCRGAACCALYPDVYALPAQDRALGWEPGREGNGAALRLREAQNAELTARIDASLTKAARFLTARQSPDGAWRSETIGFFKDGPSLTPLVLNTLHFLPQGGEAGRKAFRSGVGYLTRMVGRDGKVQAGPRGLAFPVLTAGAVIRILSLVEPTEETRRALQGWWATLRAFRLDSERGWDAADSDFGGWGFSLQPPRKPAEGEPKPPFCESNMVATLFGILGARSAKIPAGDPLYKETLVFIQRCQNFAETPETADAAFDDGGFFCRPDDPILNKAGIAGKDRSGRLRYHSYGSMTADGLRALLRCGLPPDHPRVVAARRWLETHFEAKRHPGTFNADRETLREGHFYYWTWAVAHAFLALNAREIETKAGKVRWAEALAQEMLRRQRPDGSWKNRFNPANEDDPIVCTSWAAATLAMCREML